MRIKRWIAECPLASATPKACTFDERPAPATHQSAARAQRESKEHILTAHAEPSAREVMVERTYAPRTVASEQIVS